MDTTKIATPCSEHKVSIACITFRAPNATASVICHIPIQHILTMAKSKIWMEKIGGYSICGQLSPFPARACLLSASKSDMDLDHQQSSTCKSSAHHTRKIHHPYHSLTIDSFKAPALFRSYPASVVICDVWLSSSYLARCIGKDGLGGIIELSWV
ncbi:predicted protein [Lichtheimia corymbifera JMRC:FSU:9682]|uniref:Uncharacterized protein n=1 Tax=Lichtheimia corymbifera JMRC:FSU:9682 TaxID=1263082 RepID=A0A068RF06_9FUNG|nr:predicted protein [Lichtheimia corymbifera JMRC:FSU:9682]